MRKNGKKTIKNLFITALLPLSLFLLTIWLLFFGVKSYLKNASYFTVKKVTFNNLDDKNIAQNISRKILHKNIFNTDLKKISEDLTLAYPYFHDIEIIRNFPDELIVNVIRRKPIAQIKQRGFFLVDNEGVVVSNSSGNPFGDFVVISGLSDINRLSFGKKINLPQLKIGLELSDLIKDNIAILTSAIPGFAINKVEIKLSKHPSIFVYIEELELRFYEDNLLQEFNLFKKLLPSLKSKFDKINYIDLRFAEPAISFKK